MKTIGQAVDHVMKRILDLGLAREPICYSASEAVYHLCGGRKAGLRSMKIKRGNHWFLQGPNGEIIDLTAGQFTRYTYRKLPAYSRAYPASFFPNKSTICRKLME